MPLFRLVGLLAVPLLLAACSPTFNWRALPVNGAPLSALMPCKPDQAERDVPLDGTPTRLQMRSCDAGGLTFAVAWAELADPSRVAPALAGWRRASLLAVRADPALADAAGAQWTQPVPGAVQAVGLQAQGVDHQGRPIRMKALLAARGPLVVQLAVYGNPIDEAAAATFFEGLHLP